MAFFLIVPSVIIVTIFLVHSVAERLGFRVKYFSLILCALMSLAVNAAAIEMSTYLNKWHYIRLGVLILIVSIIVTLINRYLLKHDKSEIIIIDEEATLKEAEEEIAAEVEVETKEEVKIEAENKDEVLDKPVEIKIPEQSVENEVKPQKTKETVEVETGKADDTKSSNKPAETDEIKKTDKSVEVKKVEKSLDTKQIDKSNKATETGKVDKVSKIVDADKIDKTAKSKEISKIDKPIESKKRDKAVERNKLEDKPKIEKAIDNEEKINAINAHLGSLDDILDYAYAQKSKGDLSQAILAYQKALDRYKNDDYAPFIAIDLGNIYKEQAAYSKVIKTYEEALKLPVVMRNNDTRKEFTKNLAYLRIVQSVLLRHRALTTPFSKIPSQYLQEVETEFKSAQLNSSTTRRRL